MAKSNPSPLMVAMAAAKVLSLDKKAGRGYSMQAKANKEADIWIYDEIGTYWGEGIGAKDFVRDLKALGDVETLNIHINSPGGEVFDGIAIYNALKQSKQKKRVCIDGLAASIASVIAMAGDEITIAANALMMIHKAWGLAIGNADDLRETANMLDKLDISILNAYGRTGKDDDELMSMMTAETWMTADEAVSMGFCDSITDAQQMAASFDLNKFKYRKMPEALQEKLPEGDSGLRYRLAKMNLRAQRIKAASGPK